MKEYYNVFDIETFGRDPMRPYCCGLLYRNKYYFFYGFDCLELFLNRIFILCPNNTVIFAHNLTFDGSILLSFLKKNDQILKYKSLLFEGQIFSISIKRSNVTIILKCSYKILPLSLEDIAKIMKISGKLPFDHNSVTESKIGLPSFRSNVIDYCKRDLDITNKFLTLIGFSLLDVFPTWRFDCHSISGIAMKLYKNKFYNKEFKTRLSIDTDRWIRFAYYGGRCEVFGNALPTEFQFHFDFTGMYTSMLSQNFPIGEGRIVYDVQNLDYIGFYSVIVDSSLELPILPYRCPKTKKLLFPNGIFSGVYWHEELLLFVENGGIIKKFNWAFIYDESSPIFNEFSKFCSKNRKNSPLDNVLWKLIPNSYIGRMGLRPNNNQTFIISDENYDPHDYNVIWDRKINNLWIVMIKNFEAPEHVNANVMIAAVTTSKARILWWQTATTLKNNGARLLYCDTDSLYVAYPKNIIGEKHGIIEWVDNKGDMVIKDSWFAAPKIYGVIFDNGKNEVKIKGVPRNSITFDELKINSLSKGFIKNTNDFFSKKHFKMSLKSVIKTIDLAGYDKRIFSYNKIYTKPLKIDCYPK